MRNRRTLVRLREAHECRGHRREVIWALHIQVTHEFRERLLVMMRHRLLCEEGTWWAWTEVFRLMLDCSTQLTQDVADGSINVVCVHTF